MREIWKPVPGYETLYEVSNQGLVRSLDRMCLAGPGGCRRLTGQILKPKLCGRRLMVSLCRGGKAKLFSVAELVAKRFVRKYTVDRIVIHKDGDRRNCAASNLKLVSSKEIMKRRHATQQKNRVFESLPDEEWIDIKESPFVQVSSLKRLRIKPKSITVSESGWASICTPHGAIWVNVPDLTAKYFQEKPQRKKRRKSV
jgi:hypothetical protein